MTSFTQSEIQSWERFYRGHFINSLSGYKSGSLIATASPEGHTNVAIFSNLVHIGADPALIGFVNRPRAAAPHTLTHIEATGVYTINHIREEMIAQAHQSSAKYPELVSEFEAVGLTALWRDGFRAPYVAESAVQYGMTLVEIIPIRHNGTFLVIGAVQDVWLAEGCVQADGFIDLEKAGSIATLGIDGYYRAQRIQRFGYAKPDQPPQPIY
ncbi:MAG: flavin reductase family protein [Cyclobacteriaceae bacterium]|nr:flavin reductase family protein [Cyclobacteriaceae bacterium]